VDNIMTRLKAPFAWFGAKSYVADVIWQRFGSVETYIDPFCGSLATLFARPLPVSGLEVVNDRDGFLCNFWRSVRYAPKEVAEFATMPCHEIELTSRHAYLSRQKTRLSKKLIVDDGFYDAKCAGYWAWGLSHWIGDGWCDGRGPWAIEKRQLVHAPRRGTFKLKVPHICSSQGINNSSGDEIEQWFHDLSLRLEKVKVLSGDWSRAVSPSILANSERVGIILDPPYGRDNMVYSAESGHTVADDAKQWAIANGNNSRLRIAVCGYADLEFPDNWACHEWQRQGGRTTTKAGKARMGERIWFSPSCEKPTLQLPF
jgi:DNA adenine methylase